GLDKQVGQLLCVQFRAGAGEKFGDLLVPVARGAIDGGVASGGVVGLGAAIEQEANGVEIAFVSGSMKRSAGRLTTAVVGGGVNVRAGVEKHAHGFDLAGLGGFVKRGIAAATNQTLCVSSELVFELSEHRFAHEVQERIGGEGLR